jgi:Deacetylase PdaC
MNSQGWVASLLLLIGANPAYAQNSASNPVVQVHHQDYDFSFGYPAQAAAIPKLKAIFDKEQAKARAEFIKSAVEAKADAAKSDYPYYPYEWGKVWEVAADMPQLLSLASYHSSYTGGAHGNTSHGSRIWDKKAKKFLKTSVGVFSDPKAALAVLRGDYCIGLDAERREKLGADWKAEPDSVFAGCPAFDELTLVFASSTNAGIDRITIIADPYVAGSYAEGEYQVSLAVTKALVAWIKPKYRAAFIAQ